MNLKEILKGVENADALVKAIEGDLGKEYVPRSEFNTKNEELKAKAADIEALNGRVEELKSDLAAKDQELTSLGAKVKDYEAESLKLKVATANGIPLELASRLAGDTKEDLEADAMRFAELVKTKPAAPLKDPEVSKDTNEDSAYRALLKKVKKGE